MRLTPINPVSVPATSGGYVNGLAVDGATRLLFISGQIPLTAEQTVPSSIEDQCRLIWNQIGAVLRDAGMDFSHLAKVTTFLGDRSYATVNSAVRREFLGAHEPALTVVIADIYDPAWLLEIEAVAAR